MPAGSIINFSYHSCSPDKSSFAFGIVSNNTCILVRLLYHSLSFSNYLHSTARMGRSSSCFASNWTA